MNSHSEDSETLPQARDAARRNIASLIRELPRRLKVKEANLAKRIRKLEGDAAEKLRFLYHTLDELSHYTDRFTACGKGCSACCHYKVTISKEEADLIGQTSGVMPHPPTSAHSFHGTPCPFLKDSECSIYNNRPFVCRKHVSLASTRTWCAVDVCQDTELPMLSFSEAQKGYEHIIGTSKLYDIRQFFSPVPVV